MVVILLLLSRSSTPMRISLKWFLASSLFGSDQLLWYYKHDKQNHSSWWSTKPPFSRTSNRVIQGNRAVPERTPHRKNRHAVSGICCFIKITLNHSISMREPFPGIQQMTRLLAVLVMDHSIERDCSPAGSWSTMIPGRQLCWYLLRGEDHWETYCSVTIPSWIHSRGFWKSDIAIMLNGPLHG